MATVRSEGSARRWQTVPLLLAGVANVGIAFVHVAIALIGLPAYVYFGVPDLGQAAAGGSPWPALVTFALAGVFALCGAYAFSGAGILPRLPYARAVLLAAGAIYVLRGAIVVLDIARWLRGDDYPLRQTAFSADALVIGLMILGGVVERWGDLSAGNRLAR